MIKICLKRLKAISVALCCTMVAVANNAEVDRSIRSASVPTAGKYYTIENVTRPGYIVHDEETGYAKKVESGYIYAKYWQLESSNDKFKFKNVLTGEYITTVGGGGIYSVSSMQSEFYCKLMNGFDDIYYIGDNSSSTSGFHATNYSPYNIINYSFDDAASQWRFYEATDAELQAVEEYKTLLGGLVAKGDKFKEFFSDNLCTTLKSNVTSADGIADADAKQLVESLLDDAASYKKFRVGTYEPYMTTATLKSKLKTSSQYSNYENPTGIYLKAGEICYMMVSGISDSYPVSLKIKNWVADENVTTYSLKNGFNYIAANTEGNVFVDYYTDDYKTAPNIQIHFINAPVLGYWDAETMTNTDWVNMLAGSEAEDSRIIITRSKHAQLAYPISVWKANCPANIAETMKLYQDVQDGIREMMGFQYLDLDGDGVPNDNVKNRQLFYATNYGFMAATGDGAYCHIESLGAITKPTAADFDFWGVGHEWGHNNQIVPGFKWTGCGETTNNIYASWVQINGSPSNLRLEDEVTGVNDYTDMRGGRMQTYFEEGLRKGIVWQLQDGPDSHNEATQTATVNGREGTWRHYDHFVKLSPFWQLNLWGTKAGKCKDIIPKIIDALRRYEGDYAATFDTSGKQQINWMKLACEKSGFNLLPFFERAGMLKPIDNLIDEYGGPGWVTITPEMIENLKTEVAAMKINTVTEEINYITGHNYHIYRDELKLEVPATLGEGCTYNNGKVTVSHASVENAVAFETYNSAGELLRITMYGLGSDETHSYTQVLYPGDVDENEIAAYIMAVGYDGTRAKIYEGEYIVKTLDANKYYRISSNSTGNVLSCGATTEDKDGNITWNLARAAKSETQIDQIWQWKQDGSNRYLYNPQSGYYFGGTANKKTTELYTADVAPAWKAVCIDETNSKYTFNIKGTGNYMNAYSNVDTGLYGGGASDANNVWIVEEVNSVKATVTSAGWSTLCLPFEVQIPAGVTAYIADAPNGSYLPLVALEDVIPANEPVLLEGAEGTYTFIINTTTADKKKNTLSGTTVKRTGFNTETPEYMVLANKNKGVGFYRSTAAAVPANKAYYVPQDNKVNALQFALGDETTGVENVADATEPEETFFDLNGRHVAKPTRGIYVTGTGSKVFFVK